MGKAKSMVPAVLLTTILGPLGLFYVRVKYGLVGVISVILLYVIPQAMFYIGLNFGQKDVLVWAIIMIANTINLLAAIWLISVVMAVIGVKRFFHT